MKKSTAIILSLLLFTQTTLLGQKRNAKAEKIDWYVYQFDTAIQSADTLDLRFDTVEVSASIQNKKLVASCFFEQSKRLLTVSFYSKGGELIAVKVKEQSPKMKDMFSYSAFYYENGKLFYEDYRLTVPACIGIPKDKSFYELFGYNPHLNANFLKPFVLQLYSKIKLQPT